MTLFMVKFPKVLQRLYRDVSVALGAVYCNFLNNPLIKKKVSVLELVFLQ